MVCSSAGWLATVVFNVTPAGSSAGETQTETPLAVCGVTRPLPCSRRLSSSNCQQPSHRTHRESVRCGVCAEPFDTRKSTISNVGIVLPTSLLFLNGIASPHTVSKQHVDAG